MILLKLFLAHLIGDFFLQPQKWVENKESKKLKSPKLYIHILLHAIALLLLLCDFSLWPLISTIVISHFIIDAVKLLIQRKKTKRILFFIDQFLHVIVILVCYYIYIDSSFSIQTIITYDSLLILSCGLFLTIPVSIIMKTIFSKWDITKLTENNESLVDAGKYIGILERLLVFIFIIVDHWEAVGFLITAKSVFRFGDLKESKHRKLTEYILIGTLISFGIAIAVGLLYMLLKN